MQNKELKINSWLRDISSIKIKQVELEKILNYQIIGLSTRSKNAIVLEQKHHDTTVDFLLYLFSLQSFLTLPNVGKTSGLEIQEFCNQIHGQIKRLHESKNDSIDTGVDLMRYTNTPNNLIDEYQKIHKDNKIHFFTIIDLFIQNNLSKKEKHILKHRKNYWNTELTTLEKLGRKFNVSRENKADRKNSR